MISSNIKLLFIALIGSLFGCSEHNHQLVYSLVNHNVYKDENLAYKEGVTITPGSELKIIDTLKFIQKNGFTGFVLKEARGNYIPSFYVTKFPLRESIEEFIDDHAGKFRYKNISDADDYTFISQLTFNDFSVSEAYFLVRFYFENENYYFPLDLNAKTNNLPIIETKYAEKKLVELTLKWEFDGGITNFHFEKIGSATIVKMLYMPD